MRKKFLFIFLFMVTAVTVMILTLSRPMDIQGQFPNGDPVVDTPPITQPGTDEAAPTAAAVAETASLSALTNPRELPSQMPPTPSAAEVKHITLPMQLIQSTGTMVEDFENASEWTRVSGQSPAAEAAEYKSGAHSLRVTGGKTGTIVQKRVNWDLSKSQAIRLWIDHFVNGNDTFELDLVTSADFSAYFSAKITAYGKFWNLKQVGRDEFQSHGGAEWSDPIVGLRIKVGANQDYAFDALSVNISTVPVVLINFDDGLGAVYSVALPILKSHGMAATAYIPTNLIGKPGYMSVAQLRELQANGWVIGNHTANHAHLKGLPAADQARELTTAMNMLNAWGLKGGNYVAYPDGKYDVNTLATLSKYGLLTGRTVSNATDVFPDLNLQVIRTTQDISGFTLDQVKALVAENQKHGGVLTLLFHDLAPGTGLDGTDWNAGKLNSLLDSIAAQGVYTLTIDQLYALKTGTVKINAAGR
jgi:peptidoglycan/xylan/chitin deacetylase (PgdA/CDA1 family)